MLNNFLAAAVLAAAIIFAAGTAAQRDRYEVLPTPRGTIVIDRSTGAVYQHAPLPMFGARE